MPQRWQASFDGRGEVDLTSVRILSETQIMWPAGSLVSSAAVLAAATLVSAHCKRLNQPDYPEALRKRRAIRGPVYSLPEKVLDVRSLILALSRDLTGRIVEGEITDLMPNGDVRVSGQSLRAKYIVFAAGTGNERALEMLKINERLTQRRPLRQIMVRPLPYALFAHGIADYGLPRITVTSYSIGPCQYVWYLGGAVAEQAANLDAAAALRFAQQELKQIFPQIDWDDKEWASWYGDRAEAFNAKGELPAGPSVCQQGRVLLAWPAKLTLVPALSDSVLEHFLDIAPSAKSPPPPLPSAGIGSYPWELASWHKLS
jgi:hypothetical protein